jgi:two-component system phosphate regulon response regulator PhoB
MKKRILIVDDQIEVQELLQVTFEIGDYQVLFADDGPQAIRMTQTEQPQLILLDIMMPDSEIDGLEVCRRLKTDPVTANIPIILLSAKCQEEDVKLGLAAGANDYVRKPFSPIALIQKVERELHKCSNYETVASLLG